MAIYMHMKPTAATSITPRAGRAARQLGSRIQRARLARQLTQADLAERVRASLGSIARIEKGEPGVALWVWLNAMENLGLLPQLESLADPATDALLEASAPKRAASARRRNLDF